MTKTNMTIIRLVLTLVCLDTAIIHTAINNKINAVVIVLVIGESICSKVKMDV